MANKKLSIILELKNKHFDKRIKIAKDSLVAFGKAAKKSGGSAKRFQKRLDLIAKKAENISSKFKTAMKVSLAFFVALAAKVTFASKKFSEFETGITNVLTLLSDADVKKFGDELKKGVIDITKEFGTSVQDTNKALFDLISSGVSAGDAVKVLKKSAELSVAGVTSLSTSVDGITSVLNAYGLEIEEVDKVSAAFFSAQKAGKTTVESLANNIGKVAPVAKQAGVSFQELLATTAQLTLGGLSTEEATTALRASLSALLNPAAEARKVLKKYNVPMGVSEVRAKGFRDALGKLAIAAKENPDVIGSMIPNIRALTAVASLSEESLASLDEIIKNVSEDFGEGSSLSKAFALQMKTLGISAKRNFAKLNAALIKFGAAAAPSVTKVLNVIGKLSDKISSLPDKTIKRIVGLLLKLATVMGATAVIAGFSMAIVKVNSAFKILSLTLQRKAIPALTRFLALMRASILLNPWVLGLTAITTATVLLLKKTGKLSESISFFGKMVDSVIKHSKAAIDGLLAQFKLIVDVVKAFDKLDFKGIKSAYKDYRDTVTGINEELKTSHSDSSKAIIKEEENATKKKIDSAKDVEKARLESIKKAEEEESAYYKRSFKDAVKWGKDFKGSLKTIFEDIFTAEDGVFAGSIQKGMTKLFGKAGGSIAGAAGGVLGVAAGGLIESVFSIFKKSSKTQEELVQESYERMVGIANRELSGIGKEKKREETQLDLLKKIVESQGLGAKLEGDVASTLGVADGTTVEVALKQIRDSILKTEHKKTGAIQASIDSEKKIQKARDVVSVFENTRAGRKAAEIRLLEAGVDKSTISKVLREREGGTFSVERAASSKFIKEQEKKLALASQFNLDQAVSNLNLIEDISGILGEATTKMDISSAIGGGPRLKAPIGRPSFASGTTEIPKDMVANLHKGEIVVPASFSEGIRAGTLKLSGGGNNSGDDISVGTINNSININAGQKDPAQLAEQIKPYLNGTSIKTQSGVFRGAFE